MEMTIDNIFIAFCVSLLALTLGTIFHVPHKLLMSVLIFVVLLTVLYIQGVYYKSSQYH